MMLQVLCSLLFHIYDARIKEKGMEECICQVQEDIMADGLAAPVGSEEAPDPRWAEAGDGVTDHRLPAEAAVAVSFP